MLKKVREHLDAHEKERAEVAEKKKSEDRWKKEKKAKDDAEQLVKDSEAAKKKKEKDDKEKKEKDANTKALANATAPVPPSNTSISGAGGTITINVTKDGIDKKTQDKLDIVKKAIEDAKAKKAEDAAKKLTK